MSITLYTGSMCAEKSTKVIKNLNQIQVQGHPVQLFISVIDSRSREMKQIKTHNGLIYQGPVSYIESPAEIFELWNGEKEIGIDEAQFLNSNGLIKFLNKFRTDYPGVNIYLAALDRDFRGYWFETTYTLYQYQQSWVRIVECLATCTLCGTENAVRTFRFTADGIVIKSGDQIQIGSTHNYAPVCLACFNRGMNGGLTQQHQIILKRRASLV